MKNFIPIIFFLCVGSLFAQVKSATEILNTELGKAADSDLKTVPTAPFIGALKRAFYKYPDQAIAIAQTAARYKCGQKDVIRQITEMAIYTNTKQAPAIVDAIFAQCNGQRDEIERAMNAKMVREPKEVIEDDEPTPEPTPPPNIFNFPPPPPMTPFIPVTPVTDVSRRK